MGDISDPIKNCVTENCCGSAAAVNGLSKLLLDEGLCAEEEEAQRIAKWVNKNFDLAEKGTLAPYRRSVIRLHNAKA